MHSRLAAATLPLGIIYILGCTEAVVEPDAGGGGIEEPEVAPPTEDPAPSFDIVLSEPVPASPAAGSAARFTSGGESYVSLEPGSVAGGVQVRITNLATGYTREYPLIDGGLDPVPVPAEPGDTLLLEAIDTRGVISSTRAVVAAAARPRIVRTRPPPRKRDVPLNMVVLVVFSEPMLAATTEPPAVMLLLGDDPVESTVAFQDGNPLIVEIAPTAPLEPETEYRLVVTSAARDLAGDSLETELDLSFVTEAQPVPLLLRSISAGEQHTCGLTAEGTAVCWGSTGGSLTTPEIYEPDQRFDGIAAGGTSICGYATEVLCWKGNDRVEGRSRQDFATLTAGGGHVCGVLEDGDVACWGIQLLSGSPGGGSTWLYAGRPLTVTTEEPLGALVSGADHDCGLTSSGEAYCWGSNNHGQAGSNRNSDVWVPGDTTVLAAQPVETDIRFRTLGAGGATSCGISLSGQLYCWGRQIGPSGGSSMRPVLVATPGEVAAVVVGTEHGCILDPEGIAYCWGNGSDGQAGVIRISDGPSSPVPDLMFRSLSAGSHHTCGVTFDGEVYCWGLNHYMQLGAAPPNARGLPVKVMWTP